MTNYVSNTAAIRPIRTGAARGISRIWKGVEVSRRTPEPLQASFVVACQTQRRVGRPLEEHVAVVVHSAVRVVAGNAFELPAAQHVVLDRAAETRRSHGGVPQSPPAGRG